MHSQLSIPESLQMLDEKQTAGALRISVALLRKHRSKGIGCPYVKIGRRVVYCIKDVNNYLASCTVRGRNDDQPEN
jgi:hypothetical protein